MKPAQRHDRLWLLIVPPLLSVALISSIKPSGPFAFWTEISIFCLCSLLCGFALAMKQFKKAGHRIWGTIAYSAVGMYLICCLSFLGCFWIFESGPQPSPAQQEIQRKAWTAQHIVARDALADSSMLDLSPFYDGIVPGPTLPPKGRWYYQFQHPGTHVWDGIRFDVRGTIGTGWYVETTTVSVCKKCSDVYFLHGAYGLYARSSSPLVNQFFIHFQNGRTETIPIIYGTDVSSSLFENGVVPANAVVWGAFESTNAPPRPYQGFFIKKWANPFPDDIITSIGFAPQHTGFLVAITIKEAKNQSP
jgi:hypothetical protein